MTTSWSEGRPKGLSSEDSTIAQQHTLGNFEDEESDDEHTRPPVTATKRESQNALATLPPRRPIQQDIDIAETTGDSADGEIIPPSTPPRQVTPPRTAKRLSKATTKKAAFAQQDVIPVDDFFSPSQHATPNRPPRAEASSARSALGGPGPSSSACAQRVQAQKAVKVDVQHAWSKEVKQKLRQVFKLPGFRTHQKEAIDETMAGKDGESFCRFHSY